MKKKKNWIAESKYCSQAVIHPSDNQAENLLIYFHLKRNICVLEGTIEADGGPEMPVATHYMVGDPSYAKFGQWNLTSCLNMVQIRIIIL
jgi:hypothetical protein